MLDQEGRAERGLIIRHLTLPNNVAGTCDTLLWLRGNLPRDITLSLMAQYIPLHKSKDFPTLNRVVTEEEYEEVIDFAWSLGFENVFVQQMNSQEVGAPDFGLDKPFNWS